MDVFNLIKENHADFVSLCTSHKVDKMYAFGSSVSDQFNPETSDIDLIVSVDIADAGDRGDALLSLWNQLESLFNKKVDLLTEASIQNPYLKASIDQTKKLIYDRKGEKILV